MERVMLAPLCYLLFVFLVLYGCGLLMGHDEVRSFIPGVYVRHYQGEYRDSYDTVFIQLIVPDGSEGYLIVKRSRYEKKTNEDRLMPGYEIKKWIGSYDEKTKALYLPSPGKRIYFNPKKRELKIGTEPYKKIKS